MVISTLTDGVPIPVMKRGGNWWCIIPIEGTKVVVLSEIIPLCVAILIPTGCTGPMMALAKLLRCLMQAYNEVNLGRF